jgi:serine/threonine protein kinase
MEYVRGQTLSSHLRAGRLPFSEGLRIASEIAEAIEEAHANRLVHRDLKPGNIPVRMASHPVKAASEERADGWSLEILDQLQVAAPLIGLRP